jgi:hypothetical protein
MIQDYDFLNFDNKSIEFKLSNATTAYNLKLFLSQANKLSSTDAFSTQEEYEDDSNFENDFFDISNISNMEYINPTISLKEEEMGQEDFFALYFNSSKDNSISPEFNEEKKAIFQVNYRIRCDEEENDKPKDKALFQIDLWKTFLNKKVLPKINRRRESKDNIRKKLKIVFFNNYLFKKINAILKSQQSKLYFEKFPITFVNDIRKNTNKDIIYMTLLEILSRKELYNEKDLDNYYHNLKVVESKEFKENENLKKILNKKYCELFEEFINSKEFNVDEINRLKKNNLDDVYIKRYIFQSKYFIKYFAE